MTAKKKKDINDIKDNLFIKVENATTASYDFNSLFYETIGDLLFSVQLLKEVNGIRNISEPITNIFHGEYDLSKEEWFSLALQNMLEKMPIICDRMDNVHGSMAEGISVIKQIPQPMPYPTDTELFYGNTVLFNSLATLFLSPWGTNIETIADDFETDLFIIPASAGFARILSMENENLDTDKLYAMLDQSNFQGTKVSDYVYMYYREEEEFLLLQR